MISVAVSEIREKLDAGRPTPIIDPDCIPITTKLRAAATAEVLEECAARLRLAAQSGIPLGSEEIADLADELAKQLYRRSTIRWD
jgi:hypothetical protein